MVQILHEHLPPKSPKLFQTQPLHTKYDVISAVLTRRKQRDLLEYFALPNVESNGGQIVWSTPFAASTAPIALSKLSAQDRVVLLDKVQRLHDSMLEFTTSIGETGEGRSLRSLLTAMLEVPDERHIYSVDGRPVFVYWSHEQEKPVPEVEYPLLERIGNRVMPPPAPPLNAPKSSDAAKQQQPPSQSLVVTDGWLVVVGAVSFFGIALASAALAAVALYVLVSSPEQTTSAALTVIEASQPHDRQ